MFSNLERLYKGQLIWDDSTLLLYLAIVLFGTFFAWLSKNKSLVKDKGYAKRPFLFFSFLIFLFFLILRDVGADVPMYKIIYNNSDLDSSFFNNQEPGFLIINRILKFCSFSDTVAIGIFGFLTVYLYFISIQHFSNSINVPLAVFAYGCLYYFQSYSLIRMYLASGILLFAARYLFNFQYKKYCLIILLTIFIHYSAILAYIPVIFIYFYKKNKQLFVITYFLAFILGFIAMNFLSNIPIFARYDEYLSGGMMKGGIGLFQFAINLPVLLLFFYSKKKMKGSSILEITFVFTLSALLIGIMSYKVMMIGRSLVYYNLIFIICVPYIISYLKKSHDKNYKFINFSFYLYFFWRLYQYFSEYLLFDKIMPYKFLDI